MGRFKYFILLGEMRTGSNFLEANLNQFDRITSYGELFNPVFIGQHNRDALFGFNIAGREKDPIGFIDEVRKNTDGIAGFRFFNDHDPRVLRHCLDDPDSAKIILTRNPLDSYVSLKIASETGQWKLSDAKKRRTAKIRFDADEFSAQLRAKQEFQVEILKALQVSGQSAFYLSYEDIQDLDVLNGLAQFLGVEARIDKLSKSLKKQNPGEIKDKVTNFEEMQQALSSTDYFDLNRTPNFEPRRGPGVPGYVLGAQTPLIFLPIHSGPGDAICAWLAALDGVDRAGLRTGLNQKDLRQWKRHNPSHRSFTVLRHPLARAFDSYCANILSDDADQFADIRQVLKTRYQVDPPTSAGAKSMPAHRAAFEAFLAFLKANLSGQTSLRIDPGWATQSAILQGAAQFGLPDFILREDELPKDLSMLAEKFDRKSPAYQASDHSVPFTLSDIYDETLEAACFAAYRKDYLSFGFSDWRAS